MLQPAPGASLPPKDLRTSTPSLLARLHRSAYQGDAAALWTHTTFNRATGWLNPDLHSFFRELVLHACAREKLLVPAYVMMPDHIHMVVVGLALDSDQQNAMAFVRRYLEPKLHSARFQSQAHDRVFRPEDRKRGAFARACEYVLLNPVRARLADSIGGYAYSGCVIPGYPDFHPAREDFWPKFWRIFAGMRDSNCDRHKIVPGLSTKQRLVTSSPTTNSGR